MTEHTWTYAELTRAAEQKITLWMKRSAEMGHHSYPAKICRDFAWGAHSLWFELTAGYQQPGDDERLSALQAVPQQDDQQDDHPE
ncbi:MULTISPECIES: hypothetical protein [unclassified Undibacterium]|uniref:hypothetical protein n=1 Tax=unclassified Undibacterium TaxID=2630295 RepID=UPI002AC9A3ED|nr:MULTISPECIES: hypothetical protein [unclassified Undibacterium]MEB0137971.1 hypothetical protein [Undibacterium sp. CCC2.1]MEB0170696.1 hypothetical protein [Undibacterium sp. CCC1.1]MEB0177037.1 hypothetical protein [Undibacterium sp. CCC3.4]MEB0216326.1 hypothetical protein [Undibacterium sp. 5I2]WPX42510.1 hypothetical protein RHM61_14075 [Undibacterium sp. CCC3.4]